MQKANSLVVIGALLGIGTVFPAHAYLDPGTGSMILQVILGGIAGALVVGKLYWEKVKSLFGWQDGSDSTDD